MAETAAKSGAKNNQLFCQADASLAHGVKFLTRKTQKGRIGCVTELQSHLHVTIMQVCYDDFDRNMI
jgi:hypothetical protein